MRELVSSPYFGVTLTIVAYWIGVKVQKRTGLVICNNMIISVGLIIAVLTIFNISYEEYYVGGSIINAFLGPATTCMAVSIYSKLDQLKKNLLPVLVGCFVGAATSIISILIMCRLFGLDDSMTVSLLPKSVTTPIASAISAGQGGITSITVAAVIVTGIGGNLIAPYMVKLFRVKDPVAIGLGICAASHAVGTAKAIEMGETEGAMSGLAIGICGVITAVLALSFPLLV